MKRKVIVVLLLVLLSATLGYVYFRFERNSFRQSLVDDLRSADSLYVVFKYATNAEAGEQGYKMQGDLAEDFTSHLLKNMAIGFTPSYSLSRSTIVVWTMDRNGSPQYRHVLFRSNSPDSGNGKDAALAFAVLGESISKPELKRLEDFDAPSVNNGLFPLEYQFSEGR